MYKYVCKISFLNEIYLQMYVCMVQRYSDYSEFFIKLFFPMIKV